MRHALRRKKVSIVGSGFVGATLAHWIVSRGLADVSLIDMKADFAKGLALDLHESTPIAQSDLCIQGGSDYGLAQDSDVVVITAGSPRKPNMSRDDLLKKNAQTMKSVCENLKSVVRGACYIVVSNPLDAMVYLAYQVLQEPREKVLGMAGVLDTARFKSFVAEKLQVSVQDISALVLGGHGDAMVPLTRFCTVGGVPLSVLMDDKTQRACIERTQKGGGEIVSLLKERSAYYAPSASTLEMVEAILKDEGRILPCAALLQGEYKQKDIFIGVPCQLGKEGLQKVIEISLNAEEQAQFEKSAQSVRQTLVSLESLLK